MATAPDLHEPQIAAARAQAWHQTGDALLTLEAARLWLNNYGLVLFGPRAATLGAPAPSLVEATLGEEKASITLADTTTARTLTARLVGEGSALPLNLLGGPGDLPDFLVSAQAFPFVFTLRGDKGWKRPPETSGAVKVTPLGLRVYEVLAEKGALTVGDIVGEIGREVTDSAVARALSELWQLLRVIPVLQQGEGDTLWELTTSRFLKAVKAGANAGQPTALSALASLYLSQAFVATEEEIAGFLSPVTARSRVRDVLHGLSAGRQLSEAVINGKTVLYVPDALPDFAAFAEPDTTTELAADGEADDHEGVVDAGDAVITDETSTAEGTPERIRRFGEGTDRPQDRNLRGKPLRREGSAGAGRGFADRPRRGPGGDRAGSGEGGPARRTFAPRSDAPGRPPRRPAADGERRSFSADRPAFKRRDDAGAGERRAPRADRPSFSRPWNEDRANRPPRSRDAEGGDRPARPSRPFGDRPARPYGDRPARPSGDRPARPFGDRPARPFGDRPARPFGDRPARPFGDRPARPSGDRPARPFGDRPARPFGDGPARPFGDRPARPFSDRGEGRPPRREFGSGDRPAFKRRDASEGGSAPERRPFSGGGDRPQRPYRDRNAEGGSGDRPFRPRPTGDREGGFRGGDRPARPAGGSRPSFGGGGRPSFGGGGRPSFGGGGRPSFGGGGAGRPARGPQGDRPAGRGGFTAGGARPTGGRSGGFRPGGPGGRPGGKGPGGPPRGPRPDRPARRPRPEDEA